MPPHTRRVLCSTWLPCSLDADWCLRSDVVADSCLQAWFDRDALAGDADEDAAGREDLDMTGNIEPASPTPSWHCFVGICKACSTHQPPIDLEAHCTRTGWLTRSPAPSLPRSCCHGHNHCRACQAAVRRRRSCGQGLRRRLQPGRRHRALQRARHRYRHRGDGLLRRVLARIVGDDTVPDVAGGLQLGAAAAGAPQAADLPRPRWKRRDDRPGLGRGHSRRGACRP